MTCLEQHDRIACWRHWIEFGLSRQRNIGCQGNNLLFSTSTHVGYHLDNPASSHVKPLKMLHPEGILEDGLCSMLTPAVDRDWSIAVKRVVTINFMSGPPER